MPLWYPLVYFTSINAYKKIQKDALLEKVMVYYNILCIYNYLKHNIKLTLGDSRNTSVSTTIRYLEFSINEKGILNKSSFHSGIADTQI